MSEQKRPATLKQPKSLLWADARTLLIVAFVAGLAFGTIGGYFASIELVSNARQIVVSDIVEVSKVKK